MIKICLENREQFMYPEWEKGFWFIKVRSCAIVLLQVHVVLSCQLLKYPFKLFPVATVCLK